MRRRRIWCATGSRCPHSHGRYMTAHMSAYVTVTRLLHLQVRYRVSVPELEPEPTEEEIKQVVLNARDMKPTAALLHRPAAAPFANAETKAKDKKGKKGKKGK